MKFIEWISTVSCFDKELSHAKQQNGPLQPDTNSAFFYNLSAELFVLTKNVDHLSTPSACESAECAKLDGILLTTLKNLRNACALGATVQNAITSVDQFPYNNQIEIVNTWQAIRIIWQTETLPSNDISLEIISPSTRKMCWQFVANLSVQNQQSQQKIWHEFRDLFFAYMSTVTVVHAHECTMIMYNIYLNGVSTVDAKEILALLANNINTPISQNNDFFHIFMEHLITARRDIVSLYASCECNQRLAILYYIADYMRSADHKQSVIHSVLLMNICREFKKKSDCVLKTVTTYMDRIEPKEVIAMLDVIAQASSDERYTHVLADDSSLFLNVGCLLQMVHRIGQQTNEGENMFTPVQKLGQIAPNSTENTAIERDISYELKSMLVRTIGNLAYKNKNNQNLAREMSIIMAVFDSTNIDARNPLIKEWSILAIRNLCENNLENQEIIRQMTKVGNAENSDILKELNLDMGSLRINTN